MGRVPKEKKLIIARNITALRLHKYPSRGGSKSCAEAFGVSPQQWSPWENGIRTPDETRQIEIAQFFNKTPNDLLNPHLPLLLDMPEEALAKLAIQDRRTDLIYDKHGGDILPVSEDTLKAFPHPDHLNRQNTGERPPPGAPSSPLQTPPLDIASHPRSYILSQELPSPDPTVSYVVTMTVQVGTKQIVPQVSPLPSDNHEC